MGALTDYGPLPDSELLTLLGLQLPPKYTLPPLLWAERAERAIREWEECQATIIFPLQRQLEILLGLLTPQPSATITFPAAGCEFVAGFAGGSEAGDKFARAIG